MSNTHKLRIQSAVNQNHGGSYANLSAPVLATSKIGQILPIVALDCVPGDHIPLHVSQFARFQPLNVPAYVKLDFRTMAVFVPYHQVVDGIESYISNQKYFKGVQNEIPNIPRENFCALLTNAAISSVTSTDAEADIKCGSTVATAQLRKFTPLGRYVSKVLMLLGYNWPHRDSDEHLIAFGGDSDRLPPRFSALPLLSFCHAYNSYLSYSAKYNTSALSKTLEEIKRRSQSPNTLNSTVLLTLLSSILLTYEESFFSSCWKQPYTSEPSATQADWRTTSISAIDVNGIDRSVEYDVAGGANAAVDINQATQAPGLSAQQIRLCLKFDEYFRRTNYAGSKDIEQIYSRFGVHIDDYKTRYPYFLGESSQEVQIGDVTSTAHTSEAPIGEYAGKAISDGNINVNFDCKDFGMLFVFSWYAPRPMYATGIDKHCLRLSPFDFYTPEFDNGFASAVMNAQFNVNTDHAGTTTFGYVPLYTEYLFNNAKIVGDYIRFKGYEAWHFGRTYDETQDMAAQSDNLIYIPCSGSTFERIFNISDPTLLDVDTIYQTIFIECSARRPMKDYTGKSLLGEGDIDLPNMGSQIN